MLESHWSTATISTAPGKAFSEHTRQSNWTLGVKWAPFTLPTESLLWKPEYKIFQIEFCEKLSARLKLFLYMLIMETDDLWERCENDHGWIQMRDFRSTQRYILGTNMIETDVFSMMLRTRSVDMFYSLQYRVNNQLTQVGLLGVFCISVSL